MKDSGFFSVRQDIDFIHFHAIKPLQIISSGIHGGGISRRTDIVNFHVPKTYDCSDPKRDIRQRLQNLNIRPDEATALMTAARLQDAGWSEIQSQDWSIFCCVTVGLSNAARVTDNTKPSDGPGTINTVVILDGNLTMDALVSAVITATEAKSAVLTDLGIVSPIGEIATGTTTDAIVIGTTQRSSSVIEYTGLATRFGKELGGVVYKAAYMAATHYLNWKFDHPS
jgi:adenosylcobinamide hydrolase